ncbi:MAG: PIN domain-containing protein [Treponema sp.]|jgi:predicted nucleic acid-binding protein|nr:PIN domain-containing protein [Treponema sp.]
MKVLVDTNVVLDVFLKQAPFYKDSFVIFQLADSKRISGVLATVSLTNIFYLLRKAKKDPAEVYQIMDKLTALFTVAPVVETTVASALALRWKDFEDAVQFITAKESNVEFIITRNKVDYKTSDIPCVSPAEFIAYLKEKEDNEKNV